MKRHHASIGTAGIVTMLLAGVAVAAPGRPVRASDDLTSPSPEVSATPTASASPEANRGKRLEEAKLRVCKAHEAAIKKRSDQMAERAVKMENKFADIASKVETYYTAKLVPAGKTVANYDALKTDIATKKAVVDTAVAAAKTDVSSFSCDANAPKEAMGTFRKDMQSVDKALKAYRTSIKNLTKALHKAAGDGEGTASPSPKPSESPEASASPETQQQ